MNRGELVSRVMELMFDTPFDRWSQTLVRSELNLCYKEFARRTGLCRMITQATVLSGTGEYTFNSVNVTRLKQLLIPDLEHLESMSVERALQVYGANFDTMTGTPEAFIWNYRTVTVSSVVRPVLLLVPQPTLSFDASTAARTLRAFVEYEPPDLAIDTDIPIIPNEFHERLVEGTCERLYRADNGYRDDAKAETHAAIFREGIQEALDTATVNREKNRRKVSPRIF